MARQRHGVFIQAVLDSEGRAVPRWQQVYRAVVAAIDNGALAPGARLPSARQLARDWQVARGAVDEAFDQLQAEGLLRRRVGDGTYVTLRDAPPAPPRQPTASAQRVLHRQAPVALPGRRECAFTAQRPPALHPRATALDAFPLERWRRLMLQAHARPARATLLDGHPAGLRMLREAIARHLAATRGLEVAADQVLVLDSPAHGVALLARVLLEPGDTVWVEDPSHPTMPLLFESLGARVVGVPLDDEGLDVAQGLAAAPDAALVYLHPLAQYPLAVRTRPARAQALLDWAAARRAFIVEGNFNDELARLALAEPPLMRRDAHDRVLLLGTFEGVMFPSLRVGYLVVPRPLVPAFARVRALQGHHIAGGTQWALAQFIDGGHLDAHLRAVREQLAHSRTALRETLALTLPPGVRVGPLDNAPQFCLHLPPGLRDTEVVAQLKRQGVVVEPLSTTAWQDRRLNGLVVGYAAWAGSALTEPLRRITAHLAGALATPSAGAAAVEVRRTEAGTR